MNESSKKGRRVEPATLRFERVLPGPIERVWDHLTRPELLTTWLSIDAKMELREGGKVELTMDHGEKGKLPDQVKQKIVDADTITPKVHGTVTRLVPGRTLAYTWEDAMSAEGAAKSEVTFELEPKGDDVLLELTHRRVVEKYIPQALAGWHTLLDGLDTRVRGGPPLKFFELFEANLALYAR